MTNTKCQHCGGAAQLFLCGKCTDTLRAEIRKLPELLAHLTEAAVGQTRMGDTGGRKSARKTTLQIAKSLGTITGTGDHDDQQARSAREAMLRRALSAGGCNADASGLLGRIADELASWCRLLCDDRGITYIPPMLGPWRDAHGDIHTPSYGESHVRFLLANAAAIAQSDYAGDIYGDICGRDHKRRGYVCDIEEAIDRPTRWISLGTCHAPVRVEGPNVKGLPHPTAECGAKLRADSDQTRVRCPKCRELHAVARLRMIQMSDADAQPLTWELLCKANKGQEPGFRVHWRTLYRWRDDGRLMPATIDADGNPLYLWADLQRIKAETRRGPKPKLVTAG